MLPLQERAMPATVDLPLAARSFCAAIRGISVAGKARSCKSPSGWNGG
jgi:hypothetical protein